jgi:hypothetical protein
MDLRCCLVKHSDHIVTVNWAVRLLVRAAPPDFVAAWFEGKVDVYFARVEECFGCWQSAWRGVESRHQ